MRAAYVAAFETWTSASHLRFGPTETDNRAFALAFWPDSRGVVAKTLKALLTAGATSYDPHEFARASVAGRGLTALELLLYAAPPGSDAARCALIRAVTRDLDLTATAIRADWHDSQARLMETAGANDTYRTEAEALQALYSALSNGLEFTADNRLGQPLGTYDKPRPDRAEARLAGLSQEAVALSLRSLRDLARHLTQPLADSHPDLAGQLDYAFGSAIEATDRLDDPSLASVADSAGRFRIEALQQQVRAIRDLVQGELGPALGIATGFNARDGD